ncbi:MAG TPA: DUF4034 domain-containing protein [Desulfuromonadaceae bacterium]|nr:DUF4034 domain-containing protein [Desulfuromonadaceae bacterium]
MLSISNQAVIFLNAKNYDALDTYIDKLRKSRESYDGGAWKFYFVYCGLDLPEQASELEWTNRLALLQDWINARPNSITARVALANDLTSYAWKARGSGWASTVTDEGGRLFEQRLNEASQILADAKPLKDRCPFYWTVKLITYLGLGADRSQYDATFAEATREWPDYSPYYTRRAYYLQPRWYGSDGEWEDDLTKSANRLGGDRGDILYARVVWCMHQNRLFKNIFEESHLDWARVDRGLTLIEKQFPGSLAAISEHGYLAVLARDQETARACFNRMDSRIDLSIWPSEQRFMEFASWTYNDH